MKTRRDADDVDRAHEFFFVCGHSRSGTTWLERVLDLHPRINCSGEVHFEVLRQAFDTFTSRPWHLASGPPMRQVAEACFEQTVRRCLACLSERKPEARWIGDRTPRPLRAMLPDCPHILMVRDGRDVAVSYTIHQLSTRGLDATKGPLAGLMAGPMRGILENPDHFKENPEQLFAEEPWVRHVARKWGQRMRRDLTALDKFRSGEISGRGLMVRYEDLHADTEAVRAKLYRFLEVDPAEAAPLSTDDATAAGLRAQRGAGNDRKGAIGDWRTYAIGESGRIFRRVFKEEAGPLLIRLGYEKDMVW